jgi:acyl carrier protein
MSDELFERFRKTAADSLSKPVDEIKIESNFADDLDADSLDLVEVVMSLEDRFGIAIPEDDLDGVDTIGQAADLVQARLADEARQ